MPHTELTMQAKDLIFYHNFLLRGGKGFSLEAQAAFALMDSDPPPELKVIMAAFIDSQVLSGNWPKLKPPISPGLMDCFQFYAMDTAANAVVNWIGDFSNGLLVNSPTLDPFDGITGDGITQHINTQYNPTVDGVNISQDNLMAGVFVVDNLDTTSLVFLFGFDAAVDFTMQQQDTPRVRFKANDITVRNFGSDFFLDNTLYSAERHLSSAKRIRVNGANEVFVVASTGLVNGDFQVLAVNAANNINAKVACFYASASTVGGFDYDGFLTDLNTLINDTAALG